MAPPATNRYSINIISFTCQEATTLDHNPIIFIAGMPRSGSMWTYNVCRKLITSAGKTPWPEEVPLDETPAIQHALAHPPGAKQIYCIKTHHQIPVGQPHMRIICNYRDIRDAMLSYMRFTKCSFEKGLAAARGSMALTDHYLQSQHPHVLPIRYDAITTQPQQTITRLAGFLSLSVQAADIEAIAQSLSRNAVAQQLEKLDTGEVATDRISSAPNLDGSFRLHDHTTGFQTNHISSGKDGDWRNVFSSEEQEQLMAAAADWLHRYKFIV